MGGMRCCRIQRLGPCSRERRYEFPETFERVVLRKQLLRRRRPDSRDESFLNPTLVFCRAQAERQEIIERSACRFWADLDLY